MPAGPPTLYEDRFAEEAYELCKEGFTDVKLAKFFKVTKQTLYNWKRAHPELFDSIRRGKDEFNCMTAEQSLIKRIKGGRYTETTRELAPQADGEKEVEIDGSKVMVPNIVNELVVTKKVSKMLAPDPRSIMYFLNNRAPERWKNQQSLKVSGDEDGAPIAFQDVKDRQDLKSKGDQLLKKLINGDGINE